MEDEKWDELLKISAKADLSPKTEWRYELLENYLSALNTLSLYSEKERDDLLRQLREMPDEDRAALLHRVSNKTHPNFFHLPDEEREKLEAARKELSLHERARLSGKFIFTAAGVAWLDVGEVCKAEIEIDDDSSPARESQPYAYISFSKGYWRRVETVDILESVRANPSAIGHPAIVFAIYHWQRVLRAKRVIKRDDVTSRDKLMKSYKKLFEERNVEIAERNIAAISKALAEGAKKGILPKEAALAVRMKVKGIRLDDQEAVLYRAWERLGSQYIDPTDEIDTILQKLEKDLIEFERRPYVETGRRRVSASRVIEFLRKPGRRGGRRFVGNNREGVSRRRRWKEFFHAFAAWFHEMDQSSVQQYLEDAAKMKVDGEDVYQPSFVAPKAGLPAIMSYLLATELAHVRRPVRVHETKIGFQGLIKAIEENTLEGEEGAEGE